jgi:hypothetical protein
MIKTKVAIFLLKSFILEKHSWTRGQDKQISRGYRRLAHPLHVFVHIHYFCSDGFNLKHET